MSNYELIEPYKLFVKGSWYVFNCQGRQSETGKNEVEANRILESDVEQYLKRLAIKNVEAQLSLQHNPKVSK
jgi:hypothetical protein